MLPLHGRVVDENGQPVGDVQVKLQRVSPQSPQATSAITRSEQACPQSSAAPCDSNVGVPTNAKAPPTFSTTTDDTGAFVVANLPPAEYEVRAEHPGFFVLTGQKIDLAPETTSFTFTLNHQQEVREKVDVIAAEDRIEPHNTAQSNTLTAKDILDVPVPSSHDLQQSLIALPEVLRDNQDLLHIAGARNTQSQYLLDGFEIGDPVSGQLDARLSVDAVRTAQVMTGRFGSDYLHPGAAVLSFNTPEGDDRWRFSTTDFIPGLDVQEGLQLGGYYPRLAVSGPIKRGEIWFSESISAQHSLTVINQLPAGANESNQWGGDSLTRVLWHISANHSVHGSLLYNQTGDTYLGLDALHPQSTTYDYAQQRVFGSLRDQLYWKKTLFEAGVGVDSGTSDVTPQGSGPYILKVDGAEGNYFQRTHQAGRRYQFFADAARTSLHWHGAHTISLGANFSRVELTQTAARGEIRALRADGTLDRLTTFSGSGNFGVSNSMAGGFLQDSWSLNKYLVLLAGARTDWDHLVHAALAEPRVALNVLPFKDERGKFSIGWGIYNIPLNLSVIGQTYDQQQIDTLYNGTGMVPIAGPSVSRFVLASGGLQQPYFDIASVGWQQRIAGNTIVSLELLARDEHHGLAFETLTPGQVGSDFVLHTSRRDKYRGATLSARRQFSNGTVLFANYTRSRASTDQVLDPTLGSLYFAPQSAGSLNWDAPNRFLSWGSIPTPVWGILFSYLLEYRTGYPFSAINQQQFLVGPPNSLRFPSYTNANFGVEKKFRFRGYIFAARLAVINIFGGQNANTVVNNVDAPNYLTFYGGQGRAVTGRLRFVGRK
jgi:Carboxypeptidase regulatory-like domain